MSVIYGKEKDLVNCNGGGFSVDDGEIHHGHVVVIVVVVFFRKDGEDGISDFEFFNHGSETVDWIDESAIESSEGWMVCQSTHP